MINSQAGDADPEILYNSYSFNKLVQILGGMGSKCEEIEEILTNKVPVIELYIKNDESQVIMFNRNKALIQQYLTSFNGMKSKWEGIVAAPKRRGVIVALDMANSFYQDAFTLQRTFEHGSTSMESINSIFREMESKNVVGEYRDIVNRLSALDALPKDGRLNAFPEDLTSTSEYTIVFHSPLSLLEARLMDTFDNDRTTLRHPIEGVATAKRIIKCAGYLTSLSAHPEHVAKVIEFISTRTMTPEFRREFNKSMSVNKGEYHLGSIERYCEDIVNFCSKMYPKEFQELHCVICCYLEEEPTFLEKEVEEVASNLRRNQSKYGTFLIHTLKKTGYGNTRILLSWSKLYCPFPGAGSLWLADCTFFYRGIREFVSRFMTEYSADPDMQLLLNLPGVAKEGIYSEIREVYPFCEYREGAITAPSKKRKRLPGQARAKNKKRKILNKVPLGTVTLPKNLKNKAKNVTNSLPHLKRMLEGLACTETEIPCMCREHKNYRKTYSRTIEAIMKVYSVNPKAEINESTPTVLYIKDIGSLDELQGNGTKVVYVLLA